MDFKKSLKDVAVLLIICSVFAVALAGTNMLTADIISDKRAEQSAGAYLDAIPNAKGFEDMDISTLVLPATVKEAKRETSGLGYVVKIETTGYSSGMILMIGVSSEGTILGATCPQSAETNGVEKNYGANFIGKGIDESKAVDIVAGSTLTSVAYKNAIVDAINAATILGGGSADVRTEEKILSDNLNTALGLTDAEFTKELVVEVLTGVKAVYKNEAGYVFKVGDNFVGVNADGAVNVVDSKTNPVTEGVDEIKATAESAYTIVSATSLTELTLSGELSNELANVTKVSKTATGNYVVELTAKGFGIFGDDSGYIDGSGELIHISVSLTADGKVIDAVTTDHDETDTYGGIHLKDGAYNSNFIGKTQAEAEGVDAIATCTKSTKAFKYAVLLAFETVTNFEGGATNE